jgi:NTE family protein
MNSRKTVCLALGSGSSRGWAHIGAIEALEDAGIPIDAIAGCSVGAYVGALYAAGSLSSLKAFVLRMDGRKVFSYFDVVFPRSGLLNGTKKLREFVSLLTDARDFSDLNIPVSMVATDLESGDKVVLKSGDLINALRATMSLPGLFAPARLKGKWLVDGGLVDPVPVSVARVMEGDVVIAVDLNSGLCLRNKWKNPMEPAPKTLNDPPGHKIELINKLADYYANAELGVKNRFNELFQKDVSTPDIVETVTTSIAIMQERITRINLAVDPPDILIQPRLKELKMMDFDQVEHVIHEGYLSVREKIEDIKMLLEPSCG